MMKILIIGSTGMLGYSLLSNLLEREELDVYGTARSIENYSEFFQGIESRIFQNVDVSDLASLEAVFEEVNPDVVLNCVGLIKQHDVSKQHLAAVSINALLPHQLASMCDRFNAKLIHFSTDCVFDGSKGNYQEEDLQTARDLYGKSKALGEINYGKHLTLRTSIIGHELNSSVSLIDWFLGQSGSVNGFSKAIFSGFPTAYIAKVLAEVILPRSDFSGLYNFSAESIDKYTLLSKVAEIYNKDIVIHDSDSLNIDRSLNSDQLRAELDFEPLAWDQLIDFMYADYEKRYSKGRKDA